MVRWREAGFQQPTACRRSGPYDTSETTCQLNENNSKWTSCSSERDPLTSLARFISPSSSRLTTIERSNREPASSTRSISAVIEKAAEIGAHQLSGAVLDPISLRELIPDFEKDAPLEAPVGNEHVYFLTEQGKIPAPVIPPPLKNHGNFVVSLNKLTRWLGEKCEAAGVNIFPEFPGAEMLYEGDRVIGVRTGDKGIDKSGNQKPNFEPGVDIVAKVTVLGEGVRGSLAKQLVSRLKLDRETDPQVYSVGIKELWEMPDDRFAAGSVIHTLGWPLDSHTFGGSWVYGMRDRIIDIGLAVGFDYRDPNIDPHHEFQRFKTHPLFSDLLKGGKLVRYGAKAMPVGGWYTMPQLTSDGVMIIGDSAGMLNGERLKGIHTAIKAGMLAAETILESLIKNDFTRKALSGFRQEAQRELHRSRALQGSQLPSGV